MSKKGFDKWYADNFLQKSFDFDEDNENENINH